MNQTVTIPDKRYFTIGEASSIADIKPHVLRYWEQEFSQLKPKKRAGRRYYQHRDIEIICQIRELLYDKGFTIQGARKALAGIKTETQSVPIVESKSLPKDVMKTLTSAVTELDDIASQLKK